MMDRSTADRRPAARAACRAAAILAAFLLALSLTAPSCGGKKENAPPKGEALGTDLTGDWRSDIQPGERTISSSRYRIDQSRDSIVVRLVSTKTPGGVEIVSSGMIFEARGAWKNGTARLDALYWVSGRDTCAFALIGRMDPEGRLLLFFPGNICGERSLPFTRKLQRADST